MGNRVNREQQGAGSDDVSVRVGRRPYGDPITILVADGPWWKEQMRVHPNGWQGNASDMVSQRPGI